MPDEDIVALPELVAALLTDINLAFMKANANTLKSLPFSDSAVFRLEGAEVEMQGRAAKVEGGGLFLFSQEQESKGSAFRIRLPIRVQNPPPEYPWELAGGLMLVDGERRREVYLAAIHAVGMVGMKTMGRAPVWRVGPGEYLVLVPGDKLRGARVTRGGAGWTGESLESPEALWSALGTLVEALARRYEAVLGSVT